MNINKVSIALDCKNLIGESCFWDSKENCLIWTDIEGKTIWKLDETVSYTHLRAHETN